MPQLKTIDHSRPSLKTIQQQSHRKLSKQQQAKLQKMFDEQEMQDYFIKMQTEKNTSLQSLELAGIMYSDEGIRKIATDIRVGKTQIQQQQHNVDKLLIKDTISIEQKKSTQLKMKRQQIMQQLQYLDIQTSRHGSQSAKKAIFANPELFNQQFKPPNVLSKEQHEAYVQHITKQRDILDQRHQKNVEKLQLSRQKQQQRIKQIKEKQFNKSKEKRRKKVQLALDKKKQQHEKILAQEKQTNKQYQAVRNKKFRHQEIQQKYHSEVVIPALQEKKKKLKQIRQFNKGFSINQIIKHQKQYTQKRNQSFSMIKTRVNEDWTYRPPEKTQKLSRFLEEEKIQQRKQLQQKKRKIDEKIIRQQNFINYLKQKFVPTIDESKQRQMQLRLAKQHNKRREPELDSKVLGMSYLEQAKKMRKKTIYRPETEKQHSTLQSDDDKTSKSKKNYTNYLMTIPHDKQYYEEKRRKRLQKLINSEQDDGQKIKKLFLESDKINQQLRRKQELQKYNKDLSQNAEDQAVELLLSGIQAKMGIITAFKGKKNQ